MQVNIRQLAKISGYSISTVSKALNDRAEISELTRTKIKNLAAHHNYVPNTDAVALRRKRTNTVAVFFPENHMALYVPLLEKIEAEVRKKGFRLLIAQFDEKQECPPENGGIGVDSMAVFRQAKLGEQAQSRFLHCNEHTPVIAYSFSRMQLENLSDMGVIIGKNLLKMALQKL